MSSMDPYQRQSDLFQALSHPVRLRILHILARQEGCVCHLTAVLGLRQPYISQQLALLREAGLVAGRREGTLIYYRLADDDLLTMIEAGRTLLQRLDGEPLAFGPIPEGAVAGCPCPRCRN